MLKRRVPQTHLAPELIRRRPSPPADPYAGRGTGNGNGHAGNGNGHAGNGNGHTGNGNGNGHTGNGNGHTGNGNGHNGHGAPRDDHAGPAASGALSALSQYQASRRAARDALSEDPARADLGTAHGGDTDTHDGGRS